MGLGLWRNTLSASFRGALKPRVPCEESQRHIARWPIALLGDIQIHRRHILLWPRSFFLIPAARLVEQRHQVRILFNSPRFSQIREPGFAILILLQFAV